MCVSVCIWVLPALCESVCAPACLARSVFSRASSLELRNAPNANLSGNGTDRHKNANIFNPRSLSSLYFSFHRWTVAASFICPVKVLPGGRDEKREKCEKSRQWTGDSQEKRDVGNVQLSLFFYFPGHRLVRKSGRGIKQRLLHSSCDKQLQLFFPNFYQFFFSLTHIPPRKRVPEKKE